ncbi:MAG: hypothetical protein AB1Z98_40235 [Nannocystaceae bacterium]
MRGRLGTGALWVYLLLTAACPGRARTSAEQPTTDAAHAWLLSMPLSQARDLSGLTLHEGRLYIVQNRPDPGQDAQIFALEPDGDGAWKPVHRWSLRRGDEPWVDAEAVTPSGRGTMLVLVESVGGDGVASIWEVQLPTTDPAETVPAVVERRWVLPTSYRETLGAGAEAIARVPTPDDIEGSQRSAGADGARWVLVGHQAREQIGLFRLVDAEAETGSPIASVRELTTDFGDTSGMFWTEGSLYLWHNENTATPRCRRRGGEVNVLERYPWTADTTPTELRGSPERWKHPQADDGPCPNLEGIALGPCREGTRPLYIVDDDGPPAPGLRYEIDLGCSPPAPD